MGKGKRGFVKRLVVNTSLRRSGIFDIVCSDDRDLDPIIFIYQLDPCCLEIYRMCKYQLSTSRLSKVIF